MKIASQWHEVLPGWEGRWVRKRQALALKKSGARNMMFVVPMSILAGLVVREMEANIVAQQAAAKEAVADVREPGDVHDRQGGS